MVASYSHLSTSTHAQRHAAATDLTRLQRQSPQVTIRHAEPEDYTALHQLLTEPQIIYWTIEVPFTPVAEISQRLQHREENYILVADAGDERIGTLTLSLNQSPRLRHVGRLTAVAIHPTWQGQGIGSKLMRAALDLADNWLNLHRLELLVYADNESAIALYTKFGFSSEGILRQFAFRGGQYADLQIMARIRGESSLT